MSIHHVSSSLTFSSEFPSFSNTCNYYSVFFSSQSPRRRTVGVERDFHSIDTYRDTHLCLTHPSLSLCLCVVLSEVSSKVLVGRYTKGRVSGEDVITIALGCRNEARVLSSRKDFITQESFLSLRDSFPWPPFSHRKLSRRVGLFFNAGSIDSRCFFPLS